MNSDNFKEREKGCDADSDTRRPRGLVTTLLPHQVEAVEWMRSRERVSHPGGGVLADDMGMGKTLDCIALVVSTTMPLDESPGEYEVSSARSHQTRDCASDLCAVSSSATLVVAPLCLLDQWRLQIARHTGDRARTLIYHGAGRQTALASFLRDGPDRDPSVDSRQHGDHAKDERESHSAIRFVLTTYEIVQRERTQHCRRHGHLCHRQHHGLARYGHGTVGTHSSVSKGHDKNSDNRTTLDKQGYNGRAQNVFDVLWFRVILDEAHRIRTSGSAVHDAVLALRAPRRWCVTGTPYNNSCRDLQALARFINVTPYCDDVWWETSSGGPQPSTDGRIDRWTRQFVLMRDKRLVLKDTLPTCTASSVRVRMDSAERAFYNDLVRSALRAYEAFAAAPPKDRAKPRMFGAVLAWVGRLRQACNHPLLAMGRGWRDGTPQTSRCGCCARPADNDPAGGGPGIVASCGHRLCALCASEPPANGAPSRPHATCLACGAVARWNADADLSQPRPSAKMRALVAYCVDALASDPTTRIVVFSQWTACLDLVEGFLREAKIASVRYDGDVSGIARRANILATFSASSAASYESAAPHAVAEDDGDESSPSSSVRFDSDDNHNSRARPRRMTLRSGTTVGDPKSARVLLASLHCAGVGLDLSAANHVVLVDAWYNPFIEKQACDRVHRIGQTREVKVLRLFAASTVEADVARIQARKLREAAALGLGAHDSDSMGRAMATTTTTLDTHNRDQSSLGDITRDDVQASLSETDIHEIFRRAMTRCRLRPMPAAPTRTHADTTSTVVVTMGKRKRE
ncbi:SNF2 N-incomplete domain and Helicase C-domain containing protein [Pandoravirus macleodensis]|uniref:SNF2 N-incomplete domain and Helicase C-domain containing protein n=1 Tax=Pandoravirus macleodensis TaxID=2107707 RepID=A0A2U7UEH2_9VIRU|nr:SNF2 N-incomplete domain and Helicase C-domain containing protein [Pandoravirus macleodensis]AVK76871.1 SNF2 N-incomplete domain and Helicase C-domain containing protein [Pandoravirus macleodensis]